MPTTPGKYAFIGLIPGEVDDSRKYIETVPNISPPGNKLFV
jgi:hypothetical protein